MSMLHQVQFGYWTQIFHADYNHTTSSLIFCLQLEARPRQVIRLDHAARSSGARGTLLQERCQVPMASRALAEHRTPPGTSTDTSTLALATRLVSAATSRSVSAG